MCLRRYQWEVSKIHHGHRMRTWSHITEESQKNLVWKHSSTMQATCSESDTGSLVSRKSLYQRGLFICVAQQWRHETCDGKWWRNLYFPWSRWGHPISDSRKRPYWWQRSGKSRQTIGTPWISCKGLGKDRMIKMTSIQGQLLQRKEDQPRTIMLKIRKDW